MACDWRTCNFEYCEGCEDRSNEVQSSRRAPSFEYCEYCEDHDRCVASFCLRFHLSSPLERSLLLHICWALGGRWEVLTPCRPSTGGAASIRLRLRPGWFVPSWISPDPHTRKVAVDRPGSDPGAVRRRRLGTHFSIVLRAVGNLRTFGFFKVVEGTPFADWDTWSYSHFAH